MQCELWSLAYQYGIAYIYKYVSYGWRVNKVDSLVFHDFRGYKISILVPWYHNKKFFEVAKGAVPSNTAYTYQLILL